MAECIYKSPEAEGLDSREGYHQFHHLLHYESFHVFFQGRYQGSALFPDLKTRQMNDWNNGWYWWVRLPGYLPEGAPVGPFATSQQAYQNANEWDPPIWKRYKYDD